MLWMKYRFEKNFYVLAVSRRAGRGGGGVTPINRVYGDDPLDRVWFFDFFVIDGVSILRLVSSRFEFRLIARVLG